MPFFKDLGGSSDKILGCPGGHEAYVTDKSFTVKTAAANGTKFTFDKTIGNDGKTSATAKAEFKHSSGVNFKKIQIGTDGKVAFEAEVAEAAKNTKLFVKIGTLKAAVNSIKDGKSECARSASSSTTRTWPRTAPWTSSPWTRRSSRCPSP